MSPNDFDLNPAEHWHRAIQALSIAQIYMRALEEMPLDVAAATFAIDAYDEAVDALFTHLSHLADTGTLAAITENLPLILGRVD